MQREMPFELNAEEVHMSSVLVTGGAGYIGSVTVERLAQAGHRVVVLDNLSKGHRAAMHEGVPLVVGDIGDREFVSKTLTEHKVEAVIHFAAMSLRCHAKMVSGVTMVAIVSRTFRPSGFPLAASRRRWSSVKRRRLPPDSSCSLRIRFSSTR